MLGDGYISNFLRYANQDFPSLESKIQNLTGDVIELEWKKKQSQDIIEILNSSISQLRRSLNSYEMTIGLKKLILKD
jgi:CII-binding regulator of phage lambda lysogenization HflD